MSTFNIVIDHCVLNKCKKGEEPRVEKPGQVTITSHSVTFDEFVIKCSTIYEGTLIALNWLANTVGKSIEAVKSDRSGDSSPPEDPKSQEGEDWKNS